MQQCQASAYPNYQVKNSQWCTMFELLYNYSTGLNAGKTTTEI